MAKGSKIRSEEQGLPSLSRVFGYIAAKDLSLLRDQVKLLTRLGYSNKETAIICDTTPAVVATLKSRPANPRKRGRPKKK